MAKSEKKVNTGRRSGLTQKHGEKLRNLKKSGKTQKEMATTLNVSVGTIQNWEKTLGIQNDFTLTLEREAQLRQMHLIEGKSFHEIGPLMGVSPDKAWRWAKELDIERKREVEWTQEMVTHLHKNWTTTNIDVLAEEVGVDISTLMRRAKQDGLPSKDPKRDWDSALKDKFIRTAWIFRSRAYQGKNTPQDFLNYWCLSKTHGNRLCKEFGAPIPPSPFKIRRQQVRKATLNHIDTIVEQQVEGLSFKEIAKNISKLSGVKISASSAWNAFKSSKKQGTPFYKARTIYPNLQ